ncbi:winged helix-turn-helix transcriptional regulator [Bradyrhizobium sp. 23]|nr:winged helix-turn-helix transcriptional regulator [Bradyrhizobium sp. 23]
MKNAAPLPEPSPCNSTALRKAMRRVSQLYDSALAPSGLRSTQRSIMYHIEIGENPTMGALAEALVMDRSALAHNLKPLLREGLVAVTVDPNDRRSKRAELTKRGTARLEQSKALWDIAQRKFEKVFGVRKAAELRQTLAIIASSEFESEFIRSSIK